VRFRLTRLRLRARNAVSLSGMVVATAATVLFLALFLFEILGLVTICVQNQLEHPVTAAQLDDVF
jgi:hypothetical protein